MQCKRYKDEECPVRLKVNGQQVASVENYLGCCQYVNKRPSENPIAQETFRKETRNAHIFLVVLFSILIGGLIYRLF